jgi:hypothetical protein
MKIFMVVVIILGICIVVGRLLIWRITRDFCDYPRRKKLSILDFNTATQEEKNQLFNDWCQRNGMSNTAPLTDVQLFDFVTDFRLPTLDDWKLIHGCAANQEVNKKVYDDWLRFIGVKSEAR